MSINPNIKDDYYKKGRAGMGYKKIINRIILVRHGETEANKDLMKGENIDSHCLDTKLSSCGIIQAQEICNFISNIKLKPDLVLVSKLSRAYDTANPTLNYFNSSNVEYKLDINENWIEYNHKSSDIIQGNKTIGIENWKYNIETKGEFVSRITNTFEKIKNLGTIEKPIQILIFSHSQVISTILTYCFVNNFTDDYNKINFHLANGSITCIDITEDNSFHIHCVNYTKHLTNPTGHHTPFI
jgi:broad specificity phosphatase PhoE